MALQLSFNNFPQAVHYQRFRLVQKSLSKTLMQLTAYWAQPRWPLSSCQDSIWHICAPLHVILARALVNQPDLHSIDYFCHSCPSWLYSRWFLQFNTASCTYLPIASSTCFPGLDDQHQVLLPSSPILAQLLNRNQDLQLNPASVSQNIGTSKHWDCIFMRNMWFSGTLHGAL